MKNLVKLITIAVLSLLFLVGCSANKPGDEVVAHFNNVISIMEENADLEDPEQYFSYLYFSKISDIEILSETISEDKKSARVKVGLTGIDLAKLEESVNDELSSKFFWNTLLDRNDTNYDEEFYTLAIDKIHDTLPEYRQGYINLIKVDKKWEVQEDDDYNQFIFFF